MLGTFICANCFENLQATDLGEIEIEQCNCRQVTDIPVRVFAAPEQIIEGLDPIARANQWIGDLCAVECQRCQFGIVVVVLHKEDRLLLDHHGVSPKVKKKVAPSSMAASTQIRPPCRETIRCTVARPIPVPGYSTANCLATRWPRQF